MEPHPFMEIVESFSKFSHPLTSFHVWERERECIQFIALSSGSPVRGLIAHQIFDADVISPFFHNFPGICGNHFSGKQIKSSSILSTGYLDREIIGSDFRLGFDLSLISFHFAYICSSNFEYDFCRYSFCFFLSLIIKKKNYVLM